MYHRSGVAPGEIVRIPVNTNTSAGAPATLAGTPVVRVYKDGNVAQHGTTYTPTVDFDALTGLHVVTIDTSADATFYSPGSEFWAVLQAGTVDGQSVVGVRVGSFRISALDASAAAIVYGTVTATVTPTNTAFRAAVDVAPAVSDQLKGRIVLFARDTTTPALRGQATDITASTAPGGGEAGLTCTALTTTPVVGDRFVVV